MFTTLLLCGIAALGGGDVPKMSSAQAQLDHAKKVKSEMRGAKGAARIEGLHRALDAYGAVVEHWSDSGPVTAEAAFRQGEIHRTLAQAGPARGAFQIAFESGRGTPFAPRALVELGHLRRRAGEYALALKEYARVHAVEGVHLRYRNDAREWTGKVDLLLENWQPAAEAFAAWAADAEGPSEEVRAADLEARAWVGAGLLERAESRVKEIRLSMASLADEPTKEAVALKKALERMKAPDRIREAREKQAEAAAAANGSQKSAEE